MSIVTVEKLTHYFGDKLVFKDINFRLLRHERVGLVGPNGAGKSTLLKVLTGTILPDDGSVRWLPNVNFGHLEQHIDLTEGINIRQYLRRAFQHLYEAESEMLQLSNEMGEYTPDELERALMRYSTLQELLYQESFYLIDTNIDEICNGLGITPLGMDRDVSELSGGQRTKLLLAKLLLEQPDVLLLDEPTNYLDTGHIEWLKEYLKSYPHSFILISHDTSFLNEVVNVIYHLEFKQLTRYIGNYQSFIEAYEFRKQQTLTNYVRQQQEIEKLETYIQKNKVRASTSKQAKSREKKLQKIDRIEKPDSLPTPRFSFKVAKRPVGIIAKVRDMEVGYSEALLPPISFELKRGAKVAITGHNGIGKSTMLKTLLGEIEPINGCISYGENVIPAYFAQEWNTTSTQTPIDYIWALHEDMTQKEVRQALARCGLKTEHIFQPLASLSGGEQTRVRLCDLMLKDSNWIILDEPTNHLDVQAKDSLSEAVAKYEGTVIVVSHEPEFYHNWATDVWDLEQLRE
ncbi:ABC-F family ATP-binding cassette domain-containing protein [Falsibacillus pallidus]|uniref:ATPase subunit of ABC transporter with duplicated ATPase domains n=1 Tax=Falsibacillus pallidus TaxID=493781 RepID=A0A370GNV4_9BACI|nr:ABC-F family ATP-binding cassette domain-containing protein [Falsibacillus pallidus]RDI45418.1 ATPase subunit of ABC transporter with duplicated ATPase domains [Falsibacillus pallidus]